MILLKVKIINTATDEYLHRVGRTARGAQAKGKALLILTPNELGLIRYLKSNKVIKILLDQH